ncbi:MAG TPA: hypothetical protein VFO60_01380 [Candidatus Dormibacteraeota bacterium]|nr:hypothetical protein [Candidatus Dormibacteraeota bacterium]
MTEAPDRPSRADADSLVARAIESMLEAVPTAAPEPGATDLTKYQPWADTAAPSGRNKRPLDALLDELRERVVTEPNAVAAHPQGRRPGIAYFDRFGSQRKDGAPDTGKRRRRGRGGAQGGTAAPGTGAQDAAAQGGGQRGRSPARPQGAQPPRQRPAAPPGGQGGQQEKGGATGARRRRRRGGRGSQPRGGGEG